MAHVEVRIVCSLGHTEQTLATFAPSLIADAGGAWVGDASDLANAPWDKWSLLTEWARATSNPDRVNFHSAHSARAAEKGADDRWRFHCRRCRLSVQVSDSNIGSAITTTAQLGVSKITLESLR